jgi:hypothetical protein
MNISPNTSISKNIKNLEKINVKCGIESIRKVNCETIYGDINLSRKGRSTTEARISPNFLISILKVQCQCF